MTFYDLTACTCDCHTDVNVSTPYNQLTVIDNKRLRTEVLKLCDALHVLSIQQHSTISTQQSHELHHIILQLTQCEQEFNGMVSQVESTCHQLHSSQQTILKLTSTIDALTEQLDRANKISEDVILKNHAIQTHTSELQTQYQSLSQQYNTVVGNNDTLNTQISQYHSMIQQLRAENESIHSELTECSIQQLELNDARNCMTTQRAQIDSLQEQNLQLRTLYDNRIQQLETQLLALTGSVEKDATTAQ